MSMIGKTLGSFECTALLGKGGMGEVYQAKDQKLGREVAIKVLPEEFARDADRVARFQREAKLLASLNHPNIASIHGLEEADGTHFLVMELIEGDTLAERIKTGPIPVKEALKLALQITEALEAAHEKGVIHRDLKPANIKVTPDGKVKVLDFGLAKAYAGEQADTNLSNSPTLSDAATQQGVILGTAAYMSPEQAKGKPVDTRADIWAFGIVLFEMLTGSKAFTGDTVSETLAAVLMKELDFSILPRNLNPKIREMLERCLEKDPRNRYSGISDARVDIQHVLDHSGSIKAQPAMSAGPRGKLRLAMLWISSIVLVAVLAGLAVWKLMPSQEPESREVTYISYELPEGQQFSQYAGRGIPLAISPDGRQFVYGTTDGLYVRSLGKLDAILIKGTKEDAMKPFFSPDGRWIAYFSLQDRQLNKVPLNGGPPVKLCNVSQPVAGWWGADGYIVYTEQYIGMMQVPENGGNPEEIIGRRVPEEQQNKPSGDNPPNINKRARAILEGALKSNMLPGGPFPGYLPTGHRVYQENNNLLAVPFDIQKPGAKGSPFPVLEGVRQYAVSGNGNLVYIPETAARAPTGRTLVWVDRNGNEERIDATAQDYSCPHLSPDGTKVVFTLPARNNNGIWIWDLKRKVLTKSTFRGNSYQPVWTPDGKRIVYTSVRRENDRPHTGIYEKAADNTGEEVLLIKASSDLFFSYCWSKDGRTLVGTESSDARNFDIWTLSLDGDGERNPLLHDKVLETQPSISPNGKWIAYASSDSGSGQIQIYVRPFPEVNGGQWKVSEDKGDSPLWSPDGKELFYFCGDTVMAVAVETEPGFNVVGAPKVLFKGPYACPTKNIGDSVPWDISPDGKRFLMIKKSGLTASAGAAPRKIIVVTNWFEELKDRVPID